VFANVVIGDEINRASPKTQSSLLEAMQERQVTVDNVTHRLPSPFLVIATQNPVEHEGTYPLPESQLDRFLLRVRMGYPDRQAEISMLDSYVDDMAAEDLPTVAGANSIPAMVAVSNTIHVAAAIRGYVVDLATATRNHPALQLGMSPRSTLALQRAGRALAASEGREFVIPDDIKALLSPVVEHRLVLSPEAVVSGVELPEVLAEVLRNIPVPTGRAGAG
jgi:MoxR-like ATPase